MTLKNKLLSIIAITILIDGCNPGTNNNYDEIALHHAPILYQDTDDWHYSADYITRFDYDGDWKGINNWENLSSFEINAACYYSVVETATHFFIIYAFYHPRDWTHIPYITDEHENDFEGILSVIKKDNSEFGTLIAMVTTSHTDFYSYVNPNAGLSANNKSIDGDIRFEVFQNEMHPKIYQGPRGHPIMGDSSVANFSGADDEDGVIYFPSLTDSEMPTDGNNRNVQYKLINMADYGNLWTFQLLEAKQNSSDTKTFYSWGVLKGDDGGDCDGIFPFGCPSNSSNTPWGWDDKDDKNNHRGEIALNPAKLINYYFKDLGAYETTYAYNFYIKDLQEQGFTSNFKPNGWNHYVVLEELFDLLE